MKFDVVIGNPPYQECVRTRSVAIFDKFIALGMYLGKYNCMVTPARWITDSKYEKFRKEYIHMVKEVHIYTGSKNVFREAKYGAISCYIADGNKREVHDIKVKLIDNIDGADVYSIKETFTNDIIKQLCATYTQEEINYIAKIILDRQRL